MVGLRPRDRTWINGPELAVFPEVPENKQGTVSLNGIRID